MKKTINCVVCNKNLKKTNNLLLCECGWYKSFNHKVEKLINNRIRNSMLLCTFLLLGSMCYVDQWGMDSFRVVPLKVKQWTSSLNKASYAQLKDICMRQKQYDCVEGLQRSYYHSSNDITVLDALGEFQYRRSKFVEASNTYKLYFQKLGRGAQAAYNYARILEKQGYNKQALSYYKYASSQIHSKSMSN